jgi:D-glycero-alpha-D-manno-heptose 1-phosphate guanylyltransferase
MHAIVLAGGLGTRLRVPTLPKPMAPVAGRPFLEYLLDRLVDAGIAGIVLSVGYKAEAIQQHFGTIYRGVPIQYAHEAEPLGTGGAIAYACRLTGESPVLVLNGDTYLALDLPALFAWYTQVPVDQVGQVEPVAMVLRQVPDAGRYGAITLTDGRVTALHAKGSTGPGLINAGIYFVQPVIFEQLGLTGRFSFEADVLQAHCQRLRPRAYTTSAYFIDIGIPEDLDRANIDLPQQAQHP